jgi:hypothetical protein
MAAQFQFVMRAGPTVGKIFPLEKPEISIGREAGNTVAINDSEISRRHARMELRGSAYMIQDLGSTNGTFVNGIRLTSLQVLNPGDTVTLGEGVTLMFETSGDPNVTMSSAKAPRTAARMPKPAVPAAPAPVEPAAAAPVPLEAPTKKRGGGGKVALIVIAIVVVCLILGCLALFLWVDADKTGARWCTFPFNLVAQIMGGVCQ